MPNQQYNLYNQPPQPNPPTEQQTQPQNKKQTFGQELKDWAQTGKSKNFDKYSPLKFMGIFLIFVLTIYLAGIILISSIEKSSPKLLNPEGGGFFGLAMILGLITIPIGLFNLGYIIIALLRIKDIDRLNKSILLINFLIFIVTIGFYLVMRFK